MGGKGACGNAAIAGGSRLVLTSAETVGDSVKSAAAGKIDIGTIPEAKVVGS